MENIKILILEDNLQTLSVIMSILGQLEEELDPEYNFMITTYSTYYDVEELVNCQSSCKYNIILLDRDCAASGSFHTLDIEKFGPEKIIAISMVKEYNEEASFRGVRRIITKNHTEFGLFALQLRNQVLGLMNDIRKEISVGEMDGFNSLERL